MPPLNTEAIPTTEELAEIARLVKAVVPRQRQPRWLAVLGGPPARWSRLKIDDLFRVADKISAVRSIEIDDELRTTDLARNPRATLFRLSSSPHLLRAGVRELVDAVVEDDALIVIRGTSVALASHHSDGWLVCRPPG